MYRLGCLLSLAAVAALAQPAFDVASLKPVAVTPGTYRANLGEMRHGAVILTNVTLSDCLRFAFEITNDAQIAGPGWIRNRDVRFDIEGKAAPDTPAPQLHAMLQNLLIERFRMTLHRESRELAWLALVAGRKGSKLEPAKEGTSAAGNRFVLGAIVSNRLSMHVLVLLLSRFLRQTVIDKTGLEGFYQVKLEWTPEPAAGVAAESPNPPEGLSIFAAVQEQLGLRLEARKGPLEVLVVDSADQAPQAN